MKVDAESRGLAKKAKTDVNSPWPLRAPPKLVDCSSCLTRPSGSCGVEGLWGAVGREVRLTANRCIAASACPARHGVEGRVPESRIVNCPDPPRSARLHLYPNIKQSLTVAVKLDARAVAG
jgi:hypothetical protein